MLVEQRDHEEDLAPRAHTLRGDMRPYVFLPPILQPLEQLQDRLLPDPKVRDTGKRPAPPETHPRPQLEGAVCFPRKE